MLIVGRFWYNGALKTYNVSTLPFVKILNCVPFPLKSTEVDGPPPTLQVIPRNAIISRARLAAQFVQV